MNPLSVQSPYFARPDAVWLKGNLHTHTSRSDGDLAPQQAVDAYAAAGYDFLAISDHDREPDLAGLDARNLILLPAREISASVGHLLVVGAAAAGSYPPTLLEQEHIDRARQAGAVTVLCHPSWGPRFDHYTVGHLRSFSGYTGMEIFNGGVASQAGSPFAVEKWDQVLMEGRAVWGFASDDLHARADLGAGWCVARAAARTPEALLAALHAGSFYASTGVTIRRIEVEGPRVHVEAPDAQAIAVIGEAGRRLAWAEADTLDFDACETRSPFFRIECHGPANRRAWTQPFMLRGPEIDRRRALLQRRATFEVPTLARAPEIRGDLSDPAWTDAAVTDAFLRADDGGAPEVRTEIRCFVAGKTAFFGVQCEEPFMDRLKLTIRETGSSSIWTDDSVELFLDVEGTAERYFHISVNALGVFSVREQGRIADRARVPALQVRAARARAGYTVEIAAPLAELGLSALGRPWGFNVVRNRVAVSGRFTWAFVGDSNHTPERFGRLVFPR